MTCLLDLLLTLSHVWFNIVQMIYLLVCFLHVSMLSFVGLRRTHITNACVHNCGARMAYVLHASCRQPRLCFGCFQAAYTYREETTYTYREKARLPTHINHTLPLALQVCAIRASTVCSQYECTNNERMMNE